jgi:hypothetical protein
MTFPQRTQILEDMFLSLTISYTVNGRLDGCPPTVRLWDGKARVLCPFAPQLCSTAASAACSECSVCGPTSCLRMRPWPSITNVVGRSVSR